MAVKVLFSLCELGSPFSQQREDRRAWWAAMERGIFWDVFGSSTNSPFQCSIVRSEERIATSDLVLLALNHIRPGKGQLEVSEWFSMLKRLQAHSRIATVRMKRFFFDDVDEKKNMDLTPNKDSKIEGNSGFVSFCLRYSMTFLEQLTSTISLPHLKSSVLVFSSRNERSLAEDWDGNTGTGVVFLDEQSWHLPEFEILHRSWIYHEINRENRKAIAVVLWRTHSQNCWRRDDLFASECLKAFLMYWVSSFKSKSAIQPKHEVCNGILDVPPRLHPILASHLREYDTFMRKDSKKGYLI